MGQSMISSVYEQPIPLWSVVATIAATSVFPVALVAFGWLFMWDNVFVRHASIVLLMTPIFGGLPIAYYLLTDPVGISSKKSRQLLK